MFKCLHGTQIRMGWPTGLACHAECLGLLVAAPAEKPGKRAKGSDDPSLAGGAEEAQGPRGQASRGWRAVALGRNGACHYKLAPLDSAEAEVAASIAEFCAAELGGCALTWPSASSPTCDITAFATALTDAVRRVRAHKTPSG